MRKILLFLLFTISLTVNAQKSTTSQKSSITPKSTQNDAVKNKGTEEKFGEILSSYIYSLGQITLTWKSASSTTNDKLAFNVGYVIKDNETLYYLSVFHSGLGVSSSVTLEEPFAKKWYESLLKLDEIRKKPVPDGARASYSYKNDQNIVIYYEDNRYDIRLNSLKNDKIFASDITPMISKIKEGLDRIKSLKTIDALKTLDSLNSK